MIDLLNNLGNSTYWKTIKENYYYQANSNSSKVYAGTQMPTDVDLNFAKALAAPFGKALTPGMVETIIKSTIKNKFGYDGNAIYLVLLGSDITESVAPGFNMFTDYCGYHASAYTPTNQKYYYATVGMPTGHPGCIPINVQNFPTDDAALDGSLSTIVHEIAETVTSPDEDGWQDSEFQEISDKCNVKIY